MEPPMNRFRMWQRYYRDEIRLVGVTGVCLLGLGLLIGGAIWLTQPTGPAGLVVGRVEALGFHETDLGSVPVASVRVDGRPVRIRLPARYGCMAGDRIALKRRPTRFGSSYGVGSNTRPCARD